jgi:hypothetical protein
VLRQPGISERRGVAVASSGQDENRVRLDSPRDECEHIGSQRVEPVRVLDEEEQRCVAGHVGQEIERCHGDPVVLRRDVVRQSERGVERVPLDRRQIGCAFAHRTQQLMQPGKGQVCLGLNASRGEHGHAPLARGPRGLGQQPRLADPGLAAKHERLAARRDLVEERP